MTTILIWFIFVFFIISIIGTNWCEYKDLKEKEEMLKKNHKHFQG